MPEKESPNDQVSHIVAIGASAGGLEALQLLFAKLPSNLGAAFVVVQHLSPDFKSLMSELLAKYTDMPVHQAQEGEQLETNHVYLIPAGKMMRIAENRIYLSDLPPGTRVNLPINELFRTLAEDAKRKSIGIILSGTGSDGSRGILSIKEMGGLVIVQNPEEAQFDGMPASAINTGSVDFVLPVEEIPERIAQYMNHPLGDSSVSPFQDHLAEHQDSLKGVFKLMHDNAGLDMSAYKESVVARRIEHRMNTCDIRTLSAYHQYMLENTDEVLQMKQDLLIGVTQFFRDPEVWDMVQKLVMERVLADRQNGEPIRIWCVGCSTGEEVYTIGMLMLETMEQMGVEVPFKIFASDIDHSAVAYASAGIYPDSIASEMPIEFLQRYFDQLPDGSYQITKELRSIAVFATHNLIQDPPFSNMDMITCRNTLIYMHAQTQQKAMAFFHFALRVNGFLLLGSAETPGNFSHYFKTIESKKRIYQKTKDLRIPLSSLSSRDLSSQAYKPKSLPQFISRSTSQSKKHQSKSTAPLGFSGLISEYIPPTLLLSMRLQVMYSYSDTSIFTEKIQPGRVTNDLADVLNRDVATQCLSICHEVLRKKHTVVLKDAFTVAEFQWSIRCFYIDSDDSPDGFLALSFLKDDTKIACIDDANIVEYKADESEAQRISELDNSVIEFQRLYRETLEELDTTREELQSSNEELMAANEELQSTNEELQSVNEELYTVNGEYQQKIGELTDINNDLENLIVATEMAVLFLAPDLTIRRFTSALNQYINIFDFDINRDFRDLKFKKDFPDIAKLINSVNKNGEPKDQEYNFKDHNVKVRITPYIAGAVKRGVVVSFSEV